MNDFFSDNHSRQHERPSESGNVFWYLFLCIALLGSLTYAISHSGRSSVTTLADDKQELLAAEVIGYADVVSKAVTQLRLRGTTVDQLSFANTFLSAGEYGAYNIDPFNEVFNPEGGAVVYTPPADNTTVAAGEQFMFLSGNAVHEVGTTCAGNSCVDLIMVLNDIRSGICTKINDLIGITNPGGDPPIDTALDITEKHIPGGSFVYQDVIGDEDSVLQGRTEACFEKTTPPVKNVYYKVLWSR